MIKITTRILALAFTSAVSFSTTYAQDCSNVKETKDDFSGENVKKAALSIGPAMWNWQLMIEQRADHYLLGMRIIQGGDIRYVISKGDKIQIKLENEKIVEFEANKDYLPVANAGNGIITTLWLPQGDVDIKMIKRLAHSPITAVKVVLQGTEVLLPKIKGRQTDHIMAAAGCILGETGQQ